MPHSFESMPAVVTLSHRRRSITWLDGDSAEITDRGNTYQVRRSEDGRRWFCNCPKPGTLCRHLITAELTAARPCFP